MSLVGLPIPTILLSAECTGGIASSLSQQRAQLQCSVHLQPTNLVGHCVLVGVTLLATLVLVYCGHNLQDVVMGGQGCREYKTR